MAPRVLVVDDDDAIRSSLQLALELEGYDVGVASDGGEALAQLRDEPRDVIVLDLMMPGIDGLTVCRVLRAEQDRTPVLMLTARTQTSDRVEGLDAGADDYLPKPFDLTELLARLRALLRRAQPSANGSGAEELSVGGLRMDPAARLAWCGEQDLELSKTEFDLLELLMRNEGIVLEHSTIYDRIWGYDFGPDSKNLAVYISYLRRKLAEAGCDDLIRTVRGVGYALRRAVSLRFKLVLAIVALTAASTVTIGVLSYAGIAHRLESEVDRSLDDAARQVTAPDPDGDRPGFGSNGYPTAPEHESDNNRPPSFEQILVQYLDRGGAVVVAPGGLDLPVDDHDRQVAAGAIPEYRRDVDTDDGEYRVLTTSLGGTQGAVQVARSLGETSRLLSSLRTLTMVITLAVIAAAAAAGWLIARQITRRLRQLTSAAESVAETGALDIEVRVDGTDEAGRLGTAFTKMLTALAASRDAQQRLVQDAGHELRTPLTSLRTNVSVLRRHDDLPPQTAAHVLDQIDDEAHELTDLVNELVELATDRRDQEPATDVDLGDAVRRAVSRAQRRTERDIRAVTDDSRVLAQSSSIDRALSNLIDNATKFAPDGPIDVSVRAGRVEVADRGPGIDPADIDHVFDRFFRSTTARNRPGSGLGLAIVRDAAEAHGGQVFVEPRDGGGTVIGFALPVIALGDDDGSTSIPT